MPALSVTGHAELQRRGDGLVPDAGVAAELNSLVAVGAVLAAGRTYGTPTRCGQVAGLAATSQATMGVFVIVVAVIGSVLGDPPPVVHVVEVADRFHPAAMPLETSSGKVVVSTWFWPVDGSVEVHRARGGHEAERRGDGDGRVAFAARPPLRVTVWPVNTKVLEVPMVLVSVTLAV